MSQERKTIYFKGLNGIRAIAALLVVLVHISSYHKERFGLSGLGTDIILKLEYLGSYAVTIFFTLSGFLITYLLLKEKEVATVDVKKFYIRRILRIWPLYYLYIIAFIILVLILKIQTSAIDIVCYLLLLGNIPYILNRSFFVIGHYWSIALEEQFYLVWPIAIKKIQKGMVTKFILVILLFSLLRIVLYEYATNSHIVYQLYTTSYCLRFDCMILGAVFGILIKSRHRLIHFISSSKAQLFIWIVFIGVMLGFIKLYSPLQQIIVSALACGIINSQITERTFLINLDKRIFNFLGKISYGIYIIHPMVLFGISLLVKHRQFSFYSKYIIVYVGGFGVTILLAYLSYEYFEKRILQLKRKYTIVKSSGVALN